MAVIIAAVPKIDIQLLQSTFNCNSSSQAGSPRYAFQILSEHLQITKFNVQACGMTPPTTYGSPGLFVAVEKAEKHVDDSTRS